MSDTKPPAQIIDLFEAMNADMKRRSVGDVPAPKCAECPPQVFMTGEQQHGLIAKLSASVERSAVQREIAARLARLSHQPTRADNKVRDELRSLLDCITEGRHVR